MVQGMNLGSNEPKKDRVKSVSKGERTKRTKKRKGGKRKPTSGQSKTLKNVFIVLVSLSVLVIAFFGIRYAYIAFTDDGEVPIEDRVDDSEHNSDEMLTDEYEAQKLANDHMTHNPFSKQGLVDQLFEDGVSKEDMDYAVNSVPVDWNEQVVLAAERYINYSAPEVTRESLSDQLEYEKFTDSEIKHALITVDVEGMLEEIANSVEE